VEFFLGDLYKYHVKQENRKKGQRLEAKFYVKKPKRYLKTNARKEKEEEEKKKTERKQCDHGTNPCQASNHQIRIRIRLHLLPLRAKDLNHNNNISQSSFNPCYRIEEDEDDHDDKD